MTLPRTMKAIALTGHGGLDKLAWREDVAVPQAGAGEVLITGASGGVGSAAVQLAKRRGAHVTSGAIAGPIVELDLRTLYLKDLTLIGSTRQNPAVSPIWLAISKRAISTPSSPKPIRSAVCARRRRRSSKSRIWARSGSRFPPERPGGLHE